MKGYAIVEKLIIGYVLVVATVAIIGLTYGLVVGITKECLK